jgi:triosephosphate isomerase
MPRKALIAANWKMFKTPAEAKAFVDAFLPLVAGHDRDEIALFPSPVLLPTVVDAVKGWKPAETPSLGQSSPAAFGQAIPVTGLSSLSKAAKGSDVAVGCQNMHFAEEGAYTGETSVGQLLAVGATHTLIGHSERRQYFAETDEIVNKKLHTALKHKVIPIVCVGEVLAEREAGETASVLTKQITGAFAGITAEAAGPIVIAYEPVWAIGTGKTATPEIAVDAHKIIRAEIAKLLGPDVAAAIRILYGGSVKPDNATSLIGQEEIDGALVGGASLKPDSFAAIVKY